MKSDGNGLQPLIPSIGNTVAQALLPVQISIVGARFSATKRGDMQPASTPLSITPGNPAHERYPCYEQLSAPAIFRRLARFAIVSLGGLTSAKVTIGAPGSSSLRNLNTACDGVNGIRHAREECRGVAPW
jgi:hypothetical protein